MDSKEVHDCSKDCECSHDNEGQQDEDVEFPAEFPLGGRATPACRYWHAIGLLLDRRLGSLSAARRSVCPHLSRSRWLAIELALGGGRGRKSGVMGDAGAYAELTFVLEVSAPAIRVLASRLVLSDLAARVRQRRREQDAVQLAWGGVVAAFVEIRQGEQASISCSVVVDAVFDAVAVAAAAAASNTRDGRCIFGRAASSNCTSSGAHRSTDKPLGGRQGGRLLCDMVVVVGGLEASLCRCREPLAMMVEPDCLPPALHCRKPTRIQSTASALLSR